MSKSLSAGDLFQASREVLEREFPRAFLDELRLLLSPEQLEQFLAAFAGTRIQVPTLASVKRFMEEFAVYCYLVNSRTVREFVRREEYVARRYSLSRKQIQDLLRRGREWPRGRR